MSDETTNKLSAIQYEHNAGEAAELGFDSDNQSISATQEDIAQLFGRDVSTISRHITNVFEEGELDKPTSLQKVQTTTVRPAVIYNLDVIISVGYRVSSSRATAFRKWATQIIRTYLEQGYVINEKALRDSPEKLNKLAAEVHALRSSEKQVYAKVRECFKNSSSDFDPASKHMKKF